MRKLLVFLFAFLWLLPAFSQDVVFHGFSDSVKNAQWSIEDNPADTIGNNWEFEDLLEESNPVAYCRTDTAETVNFRLVSPSFNLMGSTTTGSVEFYTLVLPVGVFDGEMAYDTTVLGQYSVSVIVDGVESVVIQHALSGIGDGWVPIRILLSDLIEDGIIDTLHSNSLQVAITFEEAFGGNNHSTFFLVDDFTYRKRDNSFVIRFMPGAGTGSMTDMMVRAGDTIMVPGCGFRAPADSSFLLWYAFDSSDSTYVLYLGDAIVAESDMIWVAFFSSNYTIRLHANNADNDSLDVPAQQYMGHLLEDNPFSNGTAVFRGWNSERDGSGTAYAAGDTLDLFLDEDDNIISTVMNFYAQWDITVSFDANGGTGTMPAATMRNFADYQIPDASFTMVHREFKGWNTAPDGSGQNYVVGATARFHTPVTLYAQWLDAPQLTVYFDANDGDGNMNDTTYYVGDAFLAPSCAFSYQWHTFVEWNTMRDGSGDSYAPGDPTSFDVNTTLYAIWSDDAITTVKFDGNGGYSSVVEDTIISEGIPFTFPDCLFEYVGVRFIGWSLAPNETETIYAPGTSAMLDSGDVWIYAQWEDLENPVSYYFYATDGDGEMPTLSVELGETFVIPSCRFTYSHYTFIGWNTEYDGSGDAYTPGQMITADEDLDLYAQWQWAGIVRIGFHDNAYNYNSNEDPQGYMAPVTANVNDGYVVPDCGFTLDGYDFVGWCTDEYGDADTILAGSVMYTQYDPLGDLITDSLTLYAIWSEQVRVIIHFDADNPMASGEMADTIVMQGDLYNLPDCGFTLDGYTFIGWSPDPYDEDIYPYAVGDIFSYPFDDDGEYIIGDYTLYALWAKVYSLDLLFVANGG
ncbi:MAG: InlB B-repeat-containing protein, partial [Bacteroidales bacterium]|nr:InlB B-repeat-containing protein [Bacteroidales bacterium]